MDTIKLTRKDIKPHIAIIILSILALTPIFLINDLSNITKESLLTICFVIILKNINFFFKEDFIVFDKDKLIITIDKRNFIFNYEKLTYIKCCVELDENSYPQNYLILTYNNKNLKLPMFEYKMIESEINQLIEKYKINKED